MTPCPLSLLALLLVPALQSQDDSASAGLTSQPASAPAPVDDGAAAAAPTAAAVDDAFFSGDMDASFDDLDTEWKTDEVIASETKVFVGPPSPLAAYRALVKHESIALLLKTRVVASVQEVPDTRRDGFELLQLRAVISGQLGHGFDYFSQVEAARSPALVDAIVGYSPLDAIKLSLGRMKVPFSGEYQVSRPDLSFVERSEALWALGLWRSEGAQLSGHFWDRRLEYRLGVYNGVEVAGLEWGRSLLYAGRVVATPLDLHARSQRFALTLGLNAAYGPHAVLDLTDKPALIEAGVLDGSRALAGVDARLQLGPVWLAGEWLYGLYDGRLSTLGRSSFFATGGYGELGAALIPGRVELMLRYDGLYSSTSAQLVQFAILGVRVFATDFFRVHLNYAWGPTYGRSAYWSPNQLQAAFTMVL